MLLILILVLGGIGFVVWKFSDGRKSPDRVRLRLLTVPPDSRTGMSSTTMAS